MRLLPPKNTLFIDAALSENKWHFDEPHEGGFADDSQPHMVRLAWVLEDPEDEVIRFTCHLIRLPEEVGISSLHAMNIALFQHQLEARGVPMIDVLEEFFDVLKESSVIVTHNWRLQRLVLERSMRSVGLNHEVWNHKTRCMMKEGGPVAGIQGPGGPGTYKDPDFAELTAAVVGSQPMVSTDPIAEGLNRVDRLRAFYHELQRIKKAG